MSSYWTSLLNLLQHEAGHLVVVSLFAPGAADGHNLFTVESKLLLEALQTLFTFAFLPSPMHPVMTHHDGLSDVPRAGFSERRFTPEINLLQLFYTDGVGDDLTGSTLPPTDRLLQCSGNTVLFSHITVVSRHVSLKPDMISIQSRVSPVQSAADICFGVGPVQE